MHAAIQHGDESFGDDGAHAGKTLGEGVGAKRQHGARGRLAERLADAAGVAAHEIDLQLADFVAEKCARVAILPKPVLTP